KLLFPEHYHPEHKVDRVLTLVDLAGALEFLKCFVVPAQAKEFFAELKVRDEVVVECRYRFPEHRNTLIRLPFSKSADSLLVEGAGGLGNVLGKVGARRCEDCSGSRPYDDLY